MDMMIKMAEISDLLEAGLSTIPIYQAITVESDLNRGNEKGHAGNLFELAFAEAMLDTVSNPI